MVLAHHWRVFAGVTFAEDDKTFTNKIQALKDDHAQRWKVRRFRLLKLFFLSSFPLFALSCRLEQTWIFLTILYLQCSASVYFDIIFLRLLLGSEGKRDANKIFFTDISFFGLSILLFLAPLFSSFWLIFIAGTAGMMLVFLLFEITVYAQAIGRMFSRTWKYLSAKDDINPAA